MVRPLPHEAANLQFASALYHPPGFANRVDVVRTCDQLSRSGSISLPWEATADEGEALLEIAVRQVVAVVQEFAVWPASEPQ